MNNENRMIINGNGMVEVEPDRVMIQLGVYTSGENLEEVQTQNAQISQAVLEALKQLGVTDIKTYQYNIEKEYEYENNKRIDKGYSVRNLFEIRIENIDQAGTVIDTAVKNGANIVENIVFEVSNPEMYYEHALNLAVNNAVQKASSISMNLNVSMNPVPQKITENSTVSVPYQTVYGINERAMATPIEPGKNKIQASVTAEFVF